MDVGLTSVRRSKSYLAKFEWTHLTENQSGLGIRALIPAHFGFHFVKY